MIRMNLEISDTGRGDSVQLRALAALFVTLADGGKADQVRAALDKVGTPEGAGLVGFRQLDPADNPAAGMPSPAEAFGAGNVVAGSGSAPSPIPASTNAGLPTAQSGAAEGAALPDPAQVFAPNAAGGAIGGTPAPVPASGSIPPAPPIAPPAAAAAAPGVELDADGLPWDPRIHALGAGGTHPKKQDGKWKVKRGTGETFLKEVEAQLRAALAAGGGNVGGPATPSGNALPLPPPVGAPVGNVQAPAPGATNSPQASPGTTNGAAASSGVTMAQLLPRVTAAIHAGLLTADTASAIASQISDGKINNVAMFAVAPALIPAFSAHLDALGIPQ